MAKLASTTISGTIRIDGYIFGLGSGFQNMVVLTSGTAATYTFPTALQVPGAKFKVTIIGGGGGGGGTGASPVAGRVGGGGGSGGVVVIYLTVLSTVAYQFTYTVGAGGGNAGTNGSTAGTAGGASSIIYNSVTYTAGGGGAGPLATAYTAGGAGGTATGGTLNIVGGSGGASGTITAQQPIYGTGGNTPLGFGLGSGWAYQTGSPASGYGAGGTGGFVDQAGLPGYNGSSGTGGVVIIEY